MAMRVGDSDKIGAWRGGNIYDEGGQVRGETLMCFTNYV